MIGCDGCGKRLFGGDYLPHYPDEGGVELLCEECYVTEVGELPGEEDIVEERPLSWTERFMEAAIGEAKNQIPKPNQLGRWLGALAPWVIAALTCGGLLIICSYAARIISIFTGVPHYD
jgi:hypothetical protein